MKTLVYSAHAYDKPSLLQSADGKHELVFTNHSLNENTADLAVGFHAISLFTSDVAGVKVLDKLHSHGVKYIALRSAGYDHVDCVKAKSLGILVANVPAYSPYAIAEHGVALLLALVRKLSLGQQLMASNDFRLDQLIGFDLHGKTVGVVGTGNIGSAFSKIMHGFGCRLLACDIAENQTLIQETMISYTDIDTLCRESDVISVSCPLTVETNYLFNKSRFAMMKTSVVFINTARGGIVDTAALIEALENRVIGAAGLDVYENEKPIYFQKHEGDIPDRLFVRLRSLPNVMITGHQGFLTEEALAGIADTMIKNLDDWSIYGKAVNEIC